MWKTKTAALGLLLAKSNVRQRQINRKWKSDQSLKKLKSTIDLRHKSLSRSKTLRRGSLVITEKTSFIQQQHLRNKVKSFAAPAIKVEESDEPMHVVSKTRELVAITNTTNKGREAASHYAKILKKSPVFEGLSNEELLKIVCKLSLTTFQPGEYLMREGSYGDTLLLIEAGKVQVTKLRHLTDDPNDLGEEVNLKILGVGSLLGEIALMTDGRRTASIYAISKVICLYMNRETFEQLVRDGHITSNMMKSTTEKNVAILELEALSKVSIFQDLCHKRILGVMGRQVFSDGETLIKQGDIADKFFLIVTGYVKVVVEDKGEVTGYRQIVMYQNNDYFGETGLLHSARRSASCIAVGRVRVLYLAKLNFEAIIPDPILKRLDALGTLCRIENTLRETDAIYASSSFVSDFSRRQCFESTIAEARNLDRTTIMTTKGSKKSRRASTNIRIKRISGGARLVSTIRTFQDKTMNYSFVPLAQLSMEKMTTNRCPIDEQKKRQLDVFFSKLGSIPKDSSTKLFKEQYRQKSKDFIHDILKTRPEKRTMLQCIFLAECFRNTQCFSSLMNQLSKKVLIELAREFKLGTFEPMDEIFSHGPSFENKSYFLMAGGVRIMKRRSSGDKRLVAILKPGDSFGELALLGIGVRPFDSVATAQSEVIVVTRESYMKVIQWKLYWPLLNLTQKATFLSKTGIFPNWAEDQLLQFSLLFHEQCYPRGSIIVEESQFSKQVIVVLRGELAVYTKQNTYKDKRHFASLKTTRRPTSAIRRAALHQSNHEKRGTKSNVNKFRRKKFREDHKTYGLQIATLEKGTIIGLGVSVQEPEPFTIIAKHDTAALVLSSQIVKNLILGGSTTNAAVKVRHRNCLAAMTAMFENQQRITNTLSLELKSQLKRSADVISKAVNFRKKMPKLKRRNEFTTSVTKKQTRPSTAGPIRLRPVETYTKKKNPTKTLKKSLNLLNKYDSLAAARFGKLDALCTRYKTTTEYWATVDNRKKKARRPFSATTRRNISMLSTIEYAKIRATRISDAILGARSPLNLKSARHMSLEH